jgi:hypothetical protein
MVELNNTTVDAHVDAVSQQTMKPQSGVDPDSVMDHPSFDWVFVPRITQGGKIKFKPQSGMETTNDNRITSAPTQTSSQNVKFRDQNPSYSYEVLSEMDPTRMLQDSDDADLGNFFSRPIKIAEEEWTTSTTLAADFDPWELYFNNPRVINRISNYNLMRCKLHVKFVINGNGFQYGRALAAYQPMDSFDSLSSHTALISQDLVQTSQLPHVYLDPTTSTGGEMILPFFYFENYVELPTAQYRNLGRMYLRSLNTLKHANGASDLVTVSVFAWATDVSLSVLTSREPSTIVPQSGKESEIDEANKTGMISGPATTVAKVSNALGIIPAIRPFAMATSNVATAVAGAAKSMGYCRPPVTKNPDPFRPTPISQLATTNTPDTALKMTVDEKQELTIDPRIAGVGPEDPMSIREIAKRESYLTKFSWNIGTAPETLLWNARIDPVTWAENAGPPQSFHFPACAMAALPFRYWTGTMKFRFQIVCSAFHKGRLKFVYDPQFLASNEYNTNYLEVIDIADTQDFTIELGNGQTRTLLDHHLPGLDSVTQMYSTTAYASEEEGNGVIGVYVVNELTTPNSTVNNDIEINVFVSMGDDFEVFVPDDHFQRFVVKPQSGRESIVPESQDTSEPSAPQHSMTDIVGPGKQDTALINMVFTGESIMSFRQLLKRYNIWRREDVAPISSFTSIDRRQNMFPFLRGNVAGAVDTTGAAAPYNYANTILLHWVVWGFSGWRGGIRYKMLFQTDKDNAVSNASSKVYIQRDNIYPAGIDSYARAVGAQPDYARNEDAAVEIIKGNGDVTGTKGAVYMTDIINSAVEFEVPYYSPYRFTPGKTENWTTGTTFNRTPNYRTNALLHGGPKSSIDYNVATAEDFQVYFFTGLPRLYYEDLAPSP